LGSCLGENGLLSCVYPLPEIHQSAHVGPDLREFESTQNAVDDEHAVDAADPMARAAGVEVKAGAETVANTQMRGRERRGRCRDARKRLSVYPCVLYSGPVALIGDSAWRSQGCVCRSGKIDRGVLWVPHASAAEDTAFSCYARQVVKDIDVSLGGIGLGHLEADRPPVVVIV